MTKATADASQALFDAIRKKSAKVGVIGLGYVGLPLIDAYVNAGFRAIGFDVDEAKTSSLNQGKSYIAHIGHETIQGWLSQDKFESTTDMSRLDEADVILICVPTPLSDSRDPDLKYVEMTAQSIAKTAQARPDDCARKHDLPGDNQRCPVANPGAIRARRRQGFFPGIQSRA